jgi:hypothetical protein
MVKRDNQQIITSKVAWIYQKNTIYKVANDINTKPGDVVVVARYKTADALDIITVGQGRPLRDV